MSRTRAIILAAGDGRRMGRLVEDRPKAMLAVCGRLLVDRQIAILKRAGYREVAMVVGYKQERLRAHLGDRVRFVENAHFSNTASLYSLWLAANLLEEGALVLKSDVLFSGTMLDRLLNAPAPDALLFDPSRPPGPNRAKVKVAGPFVVDLSRDMPLEEARGEAVGIVKVGPEGGRRLQPILDQVVAAGNRTAWAPFGFARLARTWPIVAVDTAGLPWIEIDTPDDLRRAEREIAPFIDARVRKQACP